jgi:biotin carboxylase
MFFSQAHLDATAGIPCFVFDKEESIEYMVKEFNRFCAKNEIVVNYFYNDSEYNQEKVQRFASLLKLPGALDEYQARCVRDKATMKDKLRELGYRTMLYRKLSSIDDALEFAEELGGFPFIVKWRRGLSSKEVYKIENRKQLEDLQLDYSTERFIAETYCPYLIWCFDSLVQDGKVIGTFLTWLPYTNLSFTEKKEKFAQITVKEYPEHIKFDGKKITQNLVSELGLKNGYMQIEIFVDPYGQPTICEFAWRTAGEHMLSNQSIAFDVDVCFLLIDIMVGRKIQPIPPKGQRCVGDMFLPLTDGVVAKISSYDDLKGLDGVIGGNINYKVGDVVRSKKQYTSCAGWVQVTGGTADEVLSRMLKVYKQFEIVTS